MVVRIIGNCVAQICKYVFYIVFIPNCIIAPGPSNGIALICATFLHILRYTTFSDLHKNCPGLAMDIVPGRVNVLVSIKLRIWNLFVLRMTFPVHMSLLLFIIIIIIIYHYYLLIFPMSLLLLCWNVVSYFVISTCIIFVGALLNII